ncbi:phage holin family protein [Paenibacillus sp. IITD108]|uniref:phage holin family protein n=1 Tax=Paenibacillus sp. IITD108 TaxID=3116649 RepID=UPI002F40A23E
MNSNQSIWAVTGAFLLPIFEFMYGSGDTVLYAILLLLLFIAFDWISGTSAAKKDESYGSSYGIDGLKRTLIMLFFPVGGHFIDVIFGLPGVGFGLFTGGLFYHISQSFTANIIRAGWATWLPVSVLEWLTKMVKSEIDKKIQRASERIVTGKKEA